MNPPTAKQKARDLLFLWKKAKEEPQTDSGTPSFYMREYRASVAKDAPEILQALLDELEDR